MNTQVGDFDAMAFYRALDAERERKLLNWKQLSQATGVSASTLTRMAQGRRPDADSLAKLAAWAGLNPADYVDRMGRGPAEESLTKVLAYFRADSSLTKEAAVALEEMVQAAYNRLKNKN
ncbi:helix-turn-helix domain-containing protein [Dechloromonas sp. XY25]|uniref:Helix-turn-helix domain-containing protein n=1 Tax=Dechloromonas hankyongensis TaxID=2908002 RepID=A0ABS9JY92_9RHOO|nr:XRE family transcriptional regulator [Dechloromonas hankyongensis]MCG2575872.1 helix-turn-helix domain-containing protein [Dechloromonas hankyongensis]